VKNKLNNLPFVQLQLHRAVCVGQPLQGLPPQAGVGLEHVRVLGSISSTFYAQLSQEAFICADPKSTLIKTACKMLMKLTPELFPVASVGLAVDAV